MELFTWMVDVTTMQLYLSIMHMVQVLQDYHSFQWYKSDRHLQSAFLIYFQAVSVHLINTENI